MAEAIDSIITRVQVVNGVETPNLIVEVTKIDNAQYYFGLVSVSVSYNDPLISVSLHLLICTLLILTLLPLLKMIFLSMDLLH